MIVWRLRRRGVAAVAALTASAQAHGEPTSTPTPAVVTDARAEGVSAAPAPGVVVVDGGVDSAPAAKGISPLLTKCAAQQNNSSL